MVHFRCGSKEEKPGRMNEFLDACRSFDASCCQGANRAAAAGGRGTPRAIYHRVYDFRKGCQASGNQRHHIDICER